MTVTVLAQLTINENAPHELARYFAITMPLLTKFGAVIKDRFTVTEMIVGNGPTKLVALVEYPSRQAVKDLFDSPEYQSAIEARDLAFIEYHISICATDCQETTASDHNQIEITTP